MQCTDSCLDVAEGPQRTRQTHERLLPLHAGHPRRSCVQLQGLQGRLGHGPAEQGRRRRLEEDVEQGEGCE